MLTTMTDSFRMPAFGWLSREMDRLFDAAGLQDPSALAGRSVRWPGLNIWREGDTIVAEAEIPGYRPEDIEVTATEDTLTIRGQRQTAMPEQVTPLRTERSVSRFERSVRLPVEVEADGIEATLADGVLRVTMPVAEAARPRRVQVRQFASGPSREALPAGTEAEQGKVSEQREAAAQ
jgi:HSP20 family protein